MTEDWIMTTTEPRPASQAGLSAAARELLTQRLRGRQVAPAAAGIPRLDPRPERAPLSAAQQRLYFLDRLDPGSTEYLLPAAWRLTGPLDVAALDAAVGDLTRRHEQLHVVFPDEGGIPAQRVLPAAGTLEIIAVETGDVAAAVRTAALRPFDLATEPGFRATLVRVGPEDHVLVLGMHHIVTDGWSLGILVRDLQALYAARLAGRAPELLAAAVDYTDYSVWQRETADGPESKRDLDYWREALSGLQPLDLPTDLPRPVQRSYEGVVHSVTLTRELSEALAELGSAADTTPFMTLLAAFQAALAFHSGADDLAVGTVPRPRPWSDSSSTRCCCGPTCRATRPRRNCWPVPARASWTPWSTRGSRSSGSSTS
jgi:hypothetical protein